MPRKKVTLHHLATELGLTIQTISKALRGLPGMSEETRADVIRHARARGYLTRDQKQALHVDRIAPYPVLQRRFLLLHKASESSFNELLLQGLHERFREFGHTVQQVAMPDELRHDQFAAWAEERELLFADGVFIAPRIGRELLEQQLLALPLPRILLNFPPPEAEVDSVIWDLYEAMHQAVRHLRRLGHRRILYVGDTDSQRGYVVRWHAFGEAMLELEREELRRAAEVRVEKATEKGIGSGAVNGAANGTGTGAVNGTGIGAVNGTGTRAANESGTGAADGTVNGAGDGTGADYREGDTRRYAPDPAKHSTRRDPEGRWIEELAELIRRERPTAVICGIAEEMEPVYRVLMQMEEADVRAGVADDGDERVGTVAASSSKPNKPRLSFVAFPSEQHDWLPTCSRPLLQIRATAYRAADRMLWRIANPQMPYEHIRIRGTFQAGDTTRPPESEQLT
ncbi:LacI family DNA-binding transcriptional regulator [Paenibacillus koleovorans]|uniref:LacI family DNA-binding transcriptional regulator n=1 Tax=Paenibacillus koleovorans TaxID=121608 RepID=UPI000FD7C50F|nr:LacI family DNA-binding transcriptional regulator [Paenibacillus koleovorans]